MEYTFLKHEDQIVGLYLDNGLLFDPKPGVAQAIKEYGLSPKHVLITSAFSDFSEGIAEAELPVNVEVEGVQRFPVGKNGSTHFMYRVKSDDGDFVYAPVFDRLEKKHLLNAKVAVLDAGDREEDGDLAGLSHRSYKARQRMTTNAGVSEAVWLERVEKKDVDPNVGGGVDRDKLKDSDFVFGDERKFPVVTSGDVKDAVSSWGRYKGDKSFEDFKKKLMALCKRKGESFTKMLPEKWMTSTKSVDITGLVDTVSEAFRAQFRDSQMYPWVCRVYDDHVICASDQKHYEVDYTEKKGAYAFADTKDWREVEMQMNYVPVGKSALVVEKDEDVYRWTAISSSDFKDFDGEVVSTQAMDFAIKVAEKRGDRGMLVWEHYDELPIGVCESQKRVGKFLVETGVFLDTPLAEKAVKKLMDSEPGKYRISIGFNYWKGTRSDDGTYSLIDIFHRATTTRPANPFTSIEVQETMKTLDEKTKKAIADDLGMTEQELDEVIAASFKPKVTKSAEAEHVLKEGEAPEKTEDKVDPQAALLESLKALSNQMVAMKAEFETYKTQTKEELAAALSSAPKSDIHRSTKSSEALTDEEKAKLETELQKKTKDTQEVGMPEDFYSM